jgi:WD40 repeat protein
MEISRDGSLLAVAGGNEIALLDPATLKEAGRLQGHSAWVEVIRFSHDGKLLASGSDDRTVIVWDVATGEQLEVLRGHSTHVDGVGFSPDDATLYTTSGETWLAWDLAGTRRFVARRRLAPPADTGGSGLPLPSPTGEAIAYITNTTDESTGRSVALLQVLDVDQGRARPAIDTRHGGFDSDGDASWRPDGQRLATTGGDGFVRVWDARSGTLLAEQHLASERIDGLSYTGDGRRLVVADRAGTVFTVDAETLEPDGEPIQLSIKGCCFVTASPDNRTAIALGLERFAVVDLATGRVTHEGEIGFAPEPGDFSPDGRRFAVGGHLGQLRVLDVERGEWVGPPQKAHESGVVVAYSPDGATLATGGGDGAIGLWDGQTGTLLNKLSSGRPRYVEPAFLPDGHTLLISSPDTTVSTWDTRPETWVEFACAIAGRNFTKDEWRDVFGDRPYQETCPKIDQST